MSLNAQKIAVRLGHVNGLDGINAVKAYAALGWVGVAFLRCDECGKHRLRSVVGRGKLFRAYADALTDDGTVAIKYRAELWQKRLAGQDGVADDVVVVGRKGFHGKRYGNVHPNRVAGLYVKRGACNVGGDKKLGILACPGHVADLIKADVNAGGGKFCTFVLGGYHHVGMERAVKDGSAVEYLAVVNYYGNAPQQYAFHLWQSLGQLCVLLDKGVRVENTQRPYSAKACGLCDNVGVVKAFHALGADAGLCGGVQSDGQRQHYLSVGNKHALDVVKVAVNVKRSDLVALIQLYLAALLEYLGKAAGCGK